MAASSNLNKVTATGTGPSDHLFLPPGEHVLLILGGGTYAGTLQVGNGTNFRDSYDASGAAASDFSSTGVGAFVVPGGCYRMQVDTYGSGEITMEVVSSLSVIGRSASAI